MTASVLGFAGIGVMGWPMASNLAKAGHQLLVYDLDAAKRHKFAQEHKLQAVDSLTVLGQSVDVLFLMLPTGHVVKHLLLDEQNGALIRSLRSGSIIVDMSSSEPGGTRTLGSDLKARGFTLIDAPVSGGKGGAEAATLTIMLGTDDDAAARKIEPLIRAMGKNVFRTGILGSGHATKALNNYLSATGFCAASEAVILGRKFGLDPNVMLDVINVSSGRCFATEVAMKNHVLSEKFASGFKLGLMTKDVGIAANMAAELGKAAPVGELILSLLSSARDQFGVDSDYSRVFQYLDQLEP